MCHARKSALGHIVDLGLEKDPPLFVRKHGVDIRSLEAVSSRRGNRNSPFWGEIITDTIPLRLVLTDVQFYGALRRRPFECASWVCSRDHFSQAVQDQRSF